MTYNQFLFEVLNITYMISQPSPSPSPSPYQVPLENIAIFLILPNNQNKYNHQLILSFPPILNQHHSGRYTDIPPPPSAAAFHRTNNKLGEEPTKTTRRVTKHTTVVLPPSCAVCTMVHSLFPPLTFRTAANSVLSAQTFIAFDANSFI